MLNKPLRISRIVNETYEYFKVKFSTSSSTGRYTKKKQY